MSEFGVYVHIPFCRHRCDYCAFATWTDRDHLMIAYVDAVIADVLTSLSYGRFLQTNIFPKCLS